MPGHIKGDDPELRGHALVQHQVAVLPPIGTSRVQTQQRDPLPRLFNIKTVRAAPKIETQVAPDDRIKARAHD